MHEPFSRTWKEARRLQAWHLKQQGWSQRQIAEALGVSAGALWTRGRIAAVIRVECGIAYHPRHVGRLCKSIRWSPQKPARRARQRDDAAIIRWHDETWLAIKRGRKPRGKPSSL